MKKVLIDCSEFGWSLSKVGPIYRKYSRKNPISVMCYNNRVSLYSDYAESIIHFPEWMNDFSPNCFKLEGFRESDLANLIGICQKQFDTVDIDFLIPYKIYGHCNKNIPREDKEYIVYKAKEKHRKLMEKLLPNKKNICIWPRFRQGDRTLEGRNYSSQNWNAYIKLLLNDKRLSNYNLVLLGSNDSCIKGLGNFNNLYNLINYIEKDYVGLCIAVLENSVLSVSSQSAGGILSLHTKIPTLMFGHEENRHKNQENIWNVKSEFIFSPIQKYNNIKPEQIYNKTIEMLGG